MVGLSWAFFLRGAIRASEELRVPFNALALIRSGEIDACPDCHCEIAEVDKISIVANSGFDWTGFESIVALCEG